MEFVNILKVPFAMFKDELLSLLSNVCFPVLFSKLLQTFS